MEHKLRIFFNTNAMWSTSGYGQQAQELLPLIHKEGYPLAVSNFFGQAGGKFMLDGMLQYPVINHTYGSDSLIQHAPDFGADVVFTLQDQWVLNPADLAQLKHWIPITPVDHDPVTKIVLQNLKFAYRIITYSRYGHDELKRNGIYTTYIPHTVNTEIFTPMDIVERKKATQTPPDSFLIGMVAANKDNPPRKSFQEVLDAFVMFLKVEPKALLYLHTNNDFPGGFNIRQYADFLGITDKIAFPDIYQMNFNTDKKKMNLIYNTFDCLVMPSISEGFGIPAIEAQSCGVPVIVNNFTSMPELVIRGVTGEICEVGSKRFSPQGSYMGVPDTNSLFEQMVKVHKNGRKHYTQAARDHIVRNYDTNTVFENYWKPYLAMLESEIMTEATVDKPQQPTA